MFRPTLRPILHWFGRFDVDKARLRSNGPYLWPINFLRRRLGLEPNPFNNAGLILSNLRDFEDVGYLANLFEADLAQDATSSPLAQPPDWPELDLTRVRVGPGNSLPGFVNRVTPPPIRLVTFHDVFFAHRGDRFCIFKEGCVDVRATALPSRSFLDDVGRNTAQAVPRLIYCGNQHSPDNPAHFLADHLSTAIVLLNAGFAASEIFLPSTRAPVNKTLQTAINSDLRIVSNDRLYHARELCLPTSMISQTFLHHPFHAADPLVLSTFSKACVTAAQGAVGLGPWIYLARRKAQRRRLENEIDLIERLEARGFAVIDMEDLTGPEQLAAIIAADVVVAPHGGALANLVAARKGTSVIELFHPNKGTLAFAVIAARLGLCYTSIVGQAGEEDRWRIDIEEVIRVAESTCKNTRSG
jgi:hypothetical protein